MLSKNGKPSARFFKWEIDLQLFDFTVEHIKCSDHPDDILSRLPSYISSNNVHETEFFINSITANSIPNSTTISRILKASRNDKTLCAVQLSLKSNKWFNDTKCDTLWERKEWTKLLIRTYFKVFQNCCSTSVRKQILKPDHEGVTKTSHQGITKTSHQGITKTRTLLKSKVWWPNIDNDIETEVKNCLPCLGESQPSNNSEPLISSQMPRPWEIVQIGIHGSLPSGESISGAIDALSRWPKLHILKSTNWNIISEKIE